MKVASGRSASGDLPDDDPGGSRGGGTTEPRRPRLPPRWAALAEKVFRPQPEPRMDFAFVVLAAVMYGALYFSIGSAFLPGHPAWCTVLLWAAAQIGALVAWQLRLPRVIGMLAAGMLLKNAMWEATTAFPAKWGVQMRAGALATIFLRCGLELDVGTMRRFKYPAMRLALLPGLAEAFYDGGLAVALFNMPVLLAFTMGFILKAVGPGLVVPAMFQLQKTGLGRDQGIPSTVVIAASFDDVVAITGYSIFSSIAITGQGDVAWQIASGPLQVLFGIVGGLIGGVFLGCTRLFSSRLKRLVGLYGGALLLMYFLEYYSLLSGGALGALFIGLVASNAWEKGFPRCGSLGQSFSHSPELERIIAVFWNWVWEPLLFVTIGNSINFDTLDGGIIPKSLIIICSGVVLRTLITYGVMSGFGYSWREKLFYAVAWTPKATVQAALSGAPLALIQKYKTGAPDYAEWEQWGNEILVTGIFAIVVCGTLGTLAIHLTAPRLLMPAEASVSEDSSSEADEGGEPGEGFQDEAAGAAQPGARRKTSAPRVAVVRSAEPALEPGSSHFPPHGLGLHHRRAASQMALADQDGAPLSDHELLAEYLDAIRLLTAAVHDDRKTKPDLVRLSDRVLDTQRRLEAAMERREPSVRELFRTASRLAQTFVMRPASQGSGALTAAGLVSANSRGGMHHRRSHDDVEAAAKGGEGGGSRPPSPDDMA